MSTEQQNQSSAPTLRKNKPLRSTFSFSKIRLESIALVLLSLSIIIVTLLKAIRGLAVGMQKEGHSEIVMGIGRFLQRVIHFDDNQFTLLARYEMLWIGFLGSIVAAVAKRHLGLATTEFMRPGKLRTWAERYSLFILVCVGFFLIYASVNMIVDPYLESIPEEITPSLGYHWFAALLKVLNVDKSNLSGWIPKWCLTAIFPLVLSVIVLRIPSSLSLNSDVEMMVSSEKKKSKAIWVVRILIVLGIFLAWYVGFFYKPLSEYAFFKTILAKMELWKKPIRWVEIGLLFVAFLLGTPIFAVIAAIAMLIYMSYGEDIRILPEEAFKLVENKSLIVLPLITFAGYLLAVGRSSERLIRVYKSLFGWLPGGFGVMVVLLCAVFTAYTGASGVTILALGGLLYPLLLKENYPVGFSLGLVTVSGSLGLLFPPSLPVALYSFSSSVNESPISSKEIFLGGAIPGLLMIFLVCLYVIYQGIRYNAPKQKFQLKEVFSAFWDAKWDLLLPLVVILPLFFNLLTDSNDAIALGTAYILLLGLVLKRDIHPIRDLPISLVQASSLIGSIVILLGMAAGLTNALVSAEIPTLLLEWLERNVHSKWLFLLALNAFLLVFGSILEVYSAIIILLPLIIPLALKQGITPTHLGVIFLTNLELGMLLPPVGLNLLLASNRFKKPLPFFYKQVLPFLLIMAIGVLLITYIEPLTTIGAKLPALWESMKNKLSFGGARH